AGLADFQFLPHVRLWIETADFLHFHGLPRVQQFHLHSRFQFAIKDAHVSDDAFVGVEIRIEAERLESWRARWFGRRDALDDRFEDFINADAFLGAGK